MKQDNSPAAFPQVLIDDLQVPLLELGQRLPPKMMGTVRRVNKKNKKNKKSQPLVHAELVHEASEVKAPAIKLLAMTNKPGPKGAQSLRAFETVADLLKPENLFCSPEQVIKLVEKDLQLIKLLNETSKVIQVAQRKLRKVFMAL